MSRSAVARAAPVIAVVIAGIAAGWSHARGVARRETEAATPAAIAPPEFGGVVDAVPAQDDPRLVARATTLVPGVHLLGGTFPNAAYAVESSDGITLVDTCREADAAPILAQLRALRLDPGSIRRILLTHGHADHVLGARRLREISGARVHAGRADAAALTAGAPRDALFSIFSMDAVAHGTPVDVVLDGGEVIAAGEDRFEVVATPGHTPGSVCYLLHRGGRRVLFTGDAVMSFTDGHPLAGPGIYAAALAPRYGGDAEAFESSLRRLRAMPAPDMVLPGHPRNDPYAESARLPGWRWRRLLDAGIDALVALRRRRRAEGAVFLDGEARPIVPGVVCLGEADGVAAYGLEARDGGRVLVNAPAGVDRLLARWPGADGAVGAPAAILVPSAAPAAVAGLRDLLARAPAPVFAPEAALAGLRARLPRGAEVRPASGAGAALGTVVVAITVRGHSDDETVFLLERGGLTVLLSGGFPDGVTIEPEDAGARWFAGEPRDAAALLESLDAIAATEPEVWLPLRPLAAPAARVDAETWARTVAHNRAYLESVR